MKRHARHAIRKAANTGFNDAMFLLDALIGTGDTKSIACLAVVLVQLHRIGDLCRRTSNSTKNTPSARTMNG